MGDHDVNQCVTWEQIQDARRVVEEDTNVVRTPVLRHFGQRLGLTAPIKSLSLKLENTQATGSFKIRGLANQLAKLPKKVMDGDRSVVTMSGGNYGRSFSYLLCKQNDLKATIVMPDRVPVDRIKLVESYGATVELKPNSEILQRVDEHRAAGMFYLHPFDCPDIIAGHASCGLEILADCPDVDIVVVCCGGGGILSGVAAAVKLSTQTAGSPVFGRNIKIFGVEPVGAPKMADSIRDGKPALCLHPNTIATGLSPPVAGDLTFAHVKAFVEDVVLVTDNELIQGMAALYNCGQVVEPSGAAAVAALLANKIPDVEGKNVVAVVTGGNIKPQDLANYLK